MKPKRYAIRLLGSIFIEVKAPSAKAAREAAAAWESHAREWDCFTLGEGDDPTEFMDEGELPEGTEILNASAHVGGGLPLGIRNVEDIEEDEA